MHQYRYDSRASRLLLIYSREKERSFGRLPENASRRQQRTHSFSGSISA